MQWEGGDQDVTDEGEWLDKGEAARIAGINPRTLTNLAAAGKVPGERRSGRRQWYFRRADMEALRRHYEQPKPTATRTPTAATAGTTHRRRGGKLHAERHTS